MDGGMDAPNISPGGTWWMGMGMEPRYLTWPDGGDGVEWERKFARRWQRHRQKIRKPRLSLTKDMPVGAI